MAQYYSNELAGTTTGLTTSPDAAVRPSAASGYGATLRVFRATVTYASQASGSTIVLAKIPVGYAFVSGSLVTSASTSTATIAIGTSATAGKYKAAGAVTSTDTPTAFGLGNAYAGAFSAEETVIATVGTAALPSSGTLVVDIICCGA